MLYQISYGLSYGDAVGNEIIAIDRLLNYKGIKSGIRAERPSRLMSLHPAVKRLDESFSPAPGDTILYHVTCGCDLNQRVFEYGCPVIIRYHNITPPEFFEGFDDLMESCRLGREQLSAMAGKPVLALADSGFNKDDLESAGFTCPIHVIPILRKPARPATQAMHDPHMWLTVGRLAPNKRIDRVIQIFAEYQKRYDPEARLVIAGSDRGLEKCSSELRTLCEELWGGKAVAARGAGNKRGNEDAGNALKAGNAAGSVSPVPPIFTGHITNARLNWLYHRAGLYITMSDHEGFCVPIVEAMEYGIPVVTAGGSAITETLGGSGLLLDNHDPEQVAESIHRLFSDPGYRNEILDGQYRRAAELSYKRTGRKMLKALGSVAQGIPSDSD